MAVSELVTALTELGAKTEVSLGAMTDILAKAGNTKFIRPKEAKFVEKHRLDMYRADKGTGAVLTVPYFREGGRVAAGHLSLRFVPLADQNAFHQVVVLYDRPQAIMLGDRASYPALVELARLFQTRGMPCAIQTSDARGLIEFVTERSPYDKMYHDIRVGWDRRGIGKEANKKLLLQAIDKILATDRRGDVTVALHTLRDDILGTGDIPIGPKVLITDHRYAQLARLIFDTDSQCLFTIAGSTSVPA